MWTILLSKPLAPRVKVVWFNVFKVLLFNLDFFLTFRYTNDMLKRKQIHGLTVARHKADATSASKNKDCLVFPLVNCGYYCISCLFLPDAPDALNACASAKFSYAARADVIFPLFFY